MPTADQIRQCIAVIEALRELEPDDPRYVAVEQAAAHLAKTAKKKRRRARRTDRATHDRAVLGNAERVASYRDTEHRPDVGSALLGTRACYVCKRRYDQIDSFYHWLCEACAVTSRGHREARADLGTRRAIVTGGRIKIGFEAALRLLRDGAEVTVTTRFPSDALARYRALADFEDVAARLRIVGIDFRDLRGLIAWIEEEAAGPPIDILINNAAQTIRRQPGYYSALAEAEIAALEAPAAIAIPTGSREALASFHQRCVARSAPMFPRGALDVEGLQLDLSEQNSWTKTLDEIGPVELLETHLVSAVAPFLLCAGLKRSMVRSAHPDRFIVNVSAMEGVFDFANKTPRHPHTNMAKAALNMLTRTAAADYAESGIHMVSVDTGWITDENPQATRERTGFCPPLDVHDGAARVLAPILEGVAGQPISGVFLKDFKVATW